MAFCPASAFDSAACQVVADWAESWAWPPSPQPIRQVEELPDWVWVLVWFVWARLMAALFALLLASWVPLLAPPATLPPAVVTGELPLMAFCPASAFDSAACQVVADWAESWAWPPPPQPIRQLEEPPDWVWVLVWLVWARLIAALFALLVAFWVALLAPPATLPPAVVTGELPLMAFCPASAFDSAACQVVADWAESWAWPPPPQPIRQLEEPPDWVWVLVWLVWARLIAALFALLVAFWVALLAPPATLPPAVVTGELPLMAFCPASAFDSAACQVVADWAE